MATVIYPQNIWQPNPLSGVASGIGDLGGMIGQIVGQYKDKQLLDDQLETATKNYQAGDPTGLQSILANVRTPQAKQKVMSVIGLSPQPLYQPNVETGAVEQVGSIPAGAKLLPQDIAARQAAHDERMFGKMQAQEESKSDRAAARDEAKDARQAAGKAADLAKQQSHELFLQKMGQQHQKTMFDLQTAKEAGATKKELKALGAKGIMEYQKLKADIDNKARLEVKDIMASDWSHPGEATDLIDKARTRTGEAHTELDANYGTLFEATGYKPAGWAKRMKEGPKAAPDPNDNIRKALNPGADETRMYNGKRYKVVIKNGVKGIDTSQPVD